MSSSLVPSAAQQLAQVRSDHSSSFACFAVSATGDWNAAGKAASQSRSLCHPMAPPVAIEIADALEQHHSNPQADCAVLDSSSHGLAAQTRRHRRAEAETA